MVATTAAPLSLGADDKPDDERGQNHQHVWVLTGLIPRTIEPANRGSVKPVSLILVFLSRHRQRQAPLQLDQSPASLVHPCLVDLSTPTGRSLDLGEHGASGRLNNPICHKKPVYSSEPTLPNRLTITPILAHSLRVI